MPTKMRDCCMYARTPCEKLEIKHIPDSRFPPSTGFTYRVTNDTDGVTSRQSSQSNTETASQVHEAVEQTVLHLRRRPHVTGDQDRNHQGIHRNDTGHDDRDERLDLKSALHQHVLVPPHSLRTFIIRSDLKVPTPAIPMPDLAVPYAAPMLIVVLSSRIFTPPTLSTYIRRSSTRHAVSGYSSDMDSSVGRTANAMPACDTTLAHVTKY